jgi:Flp pilus assembly pilin Flp
MFMTNRKLIYWERMEEKMKALIMNFYKDEEGLETVEWGVMLFLIITGLVALVATLGGRIADIFQSIIDELSPTEEGAG